jgi:hypothetical protein
MNIQKNEPKSYFFAATSFWKPKYIYTYQNDAADSRSLLTIVIESAARRLAQLLSPLQVTVGVGMCSSE